MKEAIAKHHSKFKWIDAFIYSYLNQRICPFDELLSIKGHRKSKNVSFNELLSMKWHRELKNVSFDELLSMKGYKNQRMCPLMIIINEGT